MPIPQFNEYGLLPSGIFNCNEKEILERYCLSNINRNQIWKLFKQFLSIPTPFSLPDHIFIDGGFTSDKPITLDIDVVMDISHLDHFSAYTAIGWWSAQRQDFKADYKVDLWLKHNLISNNLIDFFQYVKAEEALAKGISKGFKKGLLKLVL